ncbi:MAG: serine protease, partial [Cystobacter sp.]
GLVEGYRTARVEIPFEEKKVAFDIPMPGETFAAPGSKVRQFLARRGFSRLIGEAADPSATRGSETASR